MSKTLASLATSAGRRLGLSPRQVQIAELLLARRTVVMVSERLGISANTVKTHVRRLYRKLGVWSRQELLDCVISAAEEEVAAHG